MYAIRKKSSDGRVEWHSVIDGEVFWSRDTGDLKLYAHDKAVELANRWNKRDPSRENYSVVSVNEGSETGHF
jgi:hypothetical protein